MSSYQVLPLSITGLKRVDQQRVLLNLSELKIEAGEFVCIVGPNGAGKSLLLKALAGLDSELRDAVRWAGKAPSRGGYSRLSMILQDPVMLRRSVRANLDYALKSLSAAKAKERRRIIQAVLDRAKMTHLADASARMLSGGEAQRLALLRATISNPEVLLLDEPTANLDPASILWFEQQLLESHRQGLALVMVTHDLNQARRLASRVLLLHRGELIEDRPCDEFFSEPHTEETRAFINGELIF